MKTIPVRQMTLAAVILVLCSVNANAQPGSVTVEWMNKKIQELTGKVGPAADAGDSKSHAATPSVDSNSTSIVDRSNPGEFFNLPMPLANNRRLGVHAIPPPPVAPIP